jgi:hypothetical protein
MSVSINQMIRAMHKARHEIEINQIGGLSAELETIFDRAERELYRERDRFFKGLSTNARSEVIGSVKNIEAARKAVVYVKGRVEKLVTAPGNVWSDKMVNAMGEAGRELARVNLTTDFIPQAKIDAVFKHISGTERAILKVGRSDAYSIIGTIGDDINEFFRREMLNAVAEGIPVQGPGDTLSNRLFASGRLKAIPVYTKNGRTIMRSAKTRADAIARIESAKILNATHEDVTKQALGDEAVYRNSNPQDSRTTDICKYAAREKPMTLVEWSRSRFGRPPRLKPFHLCRSVLIGGMEEWFEDDGNPEPVQDATPPPQPDNPKIKGPQDFDDIEDRLKYYAEGDNIVRDVVGEAARRKRKLRKFNKELDALERERLELWGKKSQRPRLKEINERKMELLRERNKPEVSMRDYVVDLIGNKDQILVEGLPIRYEKRSAWSRLDKESRSTLNNRLGKKSPLWDEAKERLNEGRDFVNQLVHRGDSDLPKYSVSDTRVNSNFDKAEKVLKENLDDGFIVQSQYDAELKAITASRKLFDKMKNDLNYIPDIKEDTTIKALFKKAGWDDAIRITEVQTREYKPFKGLDYDIVVSDRSKLKDKFVRAFFWGYKESFGYGDKKGVIAIGKRETASVVAHELGHLIEHTVSGSHEAVKKFLAYRTKGESAVQLKKIFPSSGYGPKEFGKKDKFKDFWERILRETELDGKPDSQLSVQELDWLSIAAENNAYYTGKTYNKASEVISMGIQALFDDPVSFARTDPEYFKFLVGVLRGDLRYY